MGRQAAQTQEGQQPPEGGPLSRRTRPRGSLQPTSPRSSPTAASPRPSGPSEPEGTRLQPADSEAAVAGGPPGLSPSVTAQREAPCPHLPVKARAGCVYCRQASSRGGKKRYGELGEALPSLAPCSSLPSVQLGQILDDKIQQEQKPNCHFGRARSKSWVLRMPSAHSTSRNGWGQTS